MVFAWTINIKKTRGEFMRSASVLGVLVALITGCNDKAWDHESGLASSAGDGPSFSEFCSSWAIVCPTTPIPNFPDAKSPYTVKQWQAASSVVSALLASNNEFTITREDIEAQTLKQAVTELGVGAWYDHLLDRVQSLGWREGGLAGGAIRSTIDAVATYDGTSGARYHLEDTLQIAVDPAAELTISGMKISSPGGKYSQTLDNIRVSDTNLGEINFDELKVHAVPLKFLADEGLAGLDLDGLKNINLGMPKLVRSMRPLLDWINQSAHSVAVGEDFFGVARQKVPEWITDPSAQNLINPLLQALSSIAVHLASPDESMILARQGKNAKLVCDMTQGSQKMSFKFAGDFGLKSYQPLGDDAARLDFFGIKVTVASAMGVTITLGRVDITPDKIVIYNVPILGRYELKISDMDKPGEPATLVCKK